MSETNHSIDPPLVKWVHLWAAAASEIYLSMEAISVPNSPATEIGRRDALTMVLIDAVRNVLRGAESAAEENSAAVERFNNAHPKLKELRDRFEHYEDYVLGTGNFQKVGHKRSGKPLDLQEMVGIKISASSGGGSIGHTLSVVVTERNKDTGVAFEAVYEESSRVIAISARRLARDLMETVGLLDDHHLERCDICSSPEDI